MTHNIHSRSVVVAALAAAVTVAADLLVLIIICFFAETQNDTNNVPVRFFAPTKVRWGVNRPGVFLFSCEDYPPTSANVPERSSFDENVEGFPDRFRRI